MFEQVRVRSERSAGLLGRHTGFKPAERHGRQLRAICFFGRGWCEGHPQFRGHRITKLRRHDSHYGVVAAVQPDCFAEEVRIAAEPPLPKTVTQDGDPFESWLLFRLSESSSECGTSAQHIKETCRHAVSQDGFD